jgi:UDP-glucose 4-epimerase
MKRILITGIDGFFGRNLVSEWLNKYELVGIDLPPQLFNQQDHVDTAWYNSINQFDLREDADFYKELLVDLDVVVHCAAKTRITPSWTEYKDHYETNITGSQQLFQMCQRQGVKKFIYFSSSSVYGNNGQTVQTEDGPLCPTNPYAVSKLAAEWALKVQALKGDTELIIVRPFTMYGEHMNFGKYSLAIAKFIKACENNQPLVLENGGTQSRDFVHAVDAIQALELIMQHGRHLDVYNIGTGKTVSIKEIADALSTRQIIAPARVGHIEKTHACIDKIRALGYEPRFDLLDWLKVYLESITLKQ